jgi:integrase
MSPRRVPGVRKHRDGWEARATVGGHRISRKFKTYDEAVRWRLQQDEFSTHAQSGGPISKRSLFEDHWKRWRAGAIKRPNTLARYDSAWRSYINPKWGKSQLGRIARSDAQIWVKELAATGLSPASVRKMVQIASTCTQSAVNDGILDRNPFARLNQPELPGKKDRFVTSDEAHAIEKAMDPWWSLVIPFAMDTGLRISELCGLRVSDVIFSSPTWTVHVRQIVTEPKGHLTIGPPKTPAGIRSVPTLTPEVGARVAAHIAERGLHGNDLLFQGKYGGPMRPVNWRARIFRPAVEKAEAAGDLQDGKSIVIHGLRHGAVALWIAAGVIDYYKMATWLGHEQPGTVTKTYGHLIPEDTTWLTERLAAIRAVAEEAKPASIGEIGQRSQKRTG